MQSDHVYHLFLTPFILFRKKNIKKTNRDQKKWKWSIMFKCVSLFFFPLRMFCSKEALDDKNWTINKHSICNKGSRAHKFYFIYWSNSCSGWATGHTARCLLTVGRHSPRIIHKESWKEGNIIKKKKKILHFSFGKNSITAKPLGSFYKQSLACLNSVWRHCQNAHFSASSETAAVQRSIFIRVQGRQHAWKCGLPKLT